MAMILEFILTLFTLSLFFSKKYVACLQIRIFLVIERNVDQPWILTYYALDKFYDGLI